MPSEYVLTVYDDTPATRETFEATSKDIKTESTANGERITVYDGDPNDVLLEVFVPAGTSYTLRKTD